MVLYLPLFARSVSTVTTAPPCYHQIERKYSKFALIALSQTHGRGSEFDGQGLILLNVIFGDKFIDFQYNNMFYYVIMQIFLIKDLKK